MNNNKSNLIDNFYAVPYEIAGVREFNDIRLKSDHKIIYSYILSFRLSNNQCYANQDTISDKTGIARRVVVDVIADLKKMKLITVTHRQGISNITHANTINEALKLIEQEKTAEQQQPTKPTVKPDAAIDVSGCLDPCSDWSEFDFALGMMPDEYTEEQQSTKRVTGHCTSYDRPLCPVCGSQIDEKLICTNPECFGDMPF